MSPSSVPLLSILWALFALSVRGGFETEAFRLLQYSHNGENYGPQQSFLNLLAVSYPQTQTNEIPGLAVRCILLRSSDASVSVIANLMDKCGGIVILLSDSSSDSAQWRELEAWLLLQTFNIPVYYTHETSEWTRVYEDLSNSVFDSESLSQLWPLTNSYQVEVSASGVKPLPSTRLPTVHSVLPGSGDSSKTFAIVAYYDSLSVAPSLASGVDSNGSGMLALLEIARIFSSLYQREGSQGDYNLLFVVTSGGRLNYQGTSHWINQLDSRLKDSIEYALCLDSIGKSEELFFHVSKFAKKPRIQQLYSLFNQTASQKDIPLKFVQKKIDLDDERVYWQHEQFSKSKILGATVSSLPSAVDPRKRLDSFDNSETFSPETFKKNVNYLAEVLVHHFYDHHSVSSDLLSSVPEMNDVGLSSWLSAFDSHPRMAGFIADEDPLFDSVKNALAQYSADVTTNEQVLSNSTGFFFFSFFFISLFVSFLLFSLTNPTNSFPLHLLHPYGSDNQCLQSEACHL